MNTNTATLPNSSSRPRVISKITRADMGLNLPRLDAKCVNDDGSTDMVALAKKNELIAKYQSVYALGGLIRKAKAVKGKGDQDGIQFIGEFKAQLALTLGGTWFVAGRAHVPKMYEDVLYSELANAQQADPKATVEFLIVVGIKPPTSDKPSMTGYEWTVQTLVETDRAASPVDNLFAKVTSDGGSPFATLAAPSAAPALTAPLLPSTAPAAGSDSTAPAASTTSEANPATGHNGRRGARAAGSAS